MLVMGPRLVDPCSMLLMRAEWFVMTLALILLSSLLTRKSSPSALNAPLGPAASLCEEPSTLNETPSALNAKPSALNETPSLLRTVAQLAWLILWYPDTYEFNRCFPNLDHHFARLDALLFGCQPSLEFSQALPSPFWSEAFNLGYWSYYPMIAILVLTLFFRPLILTPKRSPLNAKPSALNEEPSPLRSALPLRSAKNAPLGPAASLCEEPSALNESPSAQPNFPLEPARLIPQEFSIFNFQFSSRVATCILLSFFLFYLIYIFLPVAGPQYYFRAVGIPEIMAGHFPSLGTYFSSHLEALAPPGWTDGLFYQLVAGAQEAGERPTAAFPSSHIGISTIVLILARRHAPRLLFLFLPLWALLCCATVYIRAHYLVDAIAGLISAPIILWLAEKIIGGGEKVVKDNVQR